MLGQQPDVSHYGNAGVNHARDRGGEGGIAFDFDRIASCFLNIPGGIQQSVAFTGVHGHERHVADDEGIGCAAPDRPAVMQGFFQSNLESIAVTQYAHAERIAHQQQINSAFRRQRGCRGVIGSQHDNLSAFLFHFSELRYGYFFCLSHFRNLLVFPH